SYLNIIIQVKTMNLEEAKKALDKVIDKARVHLYKPIQIAEILYRDRVEQDINLLDIATYRNVCVMVIRSNAL
ncbi:MAG: HaeII family restriction endonuclease, partial [Dolichospermum sp.]